MPQNIFLSYSHTDGQWTDQLRQALAARGFDAWMDRDRLLGGMTWSQSLHQGLNDCSLLVPVLSPASAVSSFVHHEVTCAKNTGKPIVPVRRAPCVLPQELAWLDRLQFVDLLRAVSNSP